MRTRYLAIIDFDRDPRRSETLAAHIAARSALIERNRLDNVCILTDRSSDCLRHAGGGVVIGQRFVTDNSYSAALGTSSDSRHDETDLLATGWGDYVAFLQHPGETAVRIVRAPPGGLAAFRACRDGVTAVASDVELLLELGFASVVIDDAFVADHLAFQHLRGARTGLAAVDELFAGDCTRITAGGSTRRGVWSPWAFAAPARQIETIEPACLQLRHVLLDTIARLARPCRSILLELSGGLDSSIVAAGLASATRATALNVVTPGAEGDERRYARLVGAHTGIAVHEAAVDPGIDLTQRLARRTPRPGLPGMLGGIDAQFAARARSEGCDAFFSGTGGDSVFCALGSSAPAADAWRRFGPGQRFRSAVGDVAEIHSINVWRAGVMALRYARRPAAPPWPRTTAFLRADRLPEQPPFHPWLLESEDTLGGTRSHIRSIMAALAHLDGYGRQATVPSVFPLLAQPVIEACLRIPTWLWVDGGRDRAVARRAFTGLLPTAVLERRTKGAMDALCVQAFQNNRARLLPYLLDGHLAATGILDRAAVEAYLRASGPVSDGLFYHLLPIIDTEAWMRTWLGDDGPAGIRATPIGHPD